MAKVTIFIINIFLLSKILCVNVFAGPTFVDEYSVASDEASATGLAFNNDGTKMYVTGIGSDEILQYTLSVAYDVTSTVTLESSRDITNVDNAPQDIKFNSDGTVIFVLGTEDNAIHRWSLSTAYDISSITQATIVADSTSTSVGGDPRGLDFNKDGTKMFILDGQDQRVEEYNLSTPYNPDTATLSKTLSNSRSNDFHQGLGFSPDGYKLYVVKSRPQSSGSNANNNIQEYDLTNAFDISTATLNETTFTPTHSNKEFLAGLAFNNDGSKMYHINWGADDEIREYTLTCAYGIVSCIDQTNDNDTVGNVEAQAEISKQFMQSSSIPIFNRMEWLRRNKNIINLSNQNIKFQFSNEILNSLRELGGEKFIRTKAYCVSENVNNSCYDVEEEMSISLNDLNFTPTSLNKNIFMDFMPEGWSSWSEGNISIGRTGDKHNSSTKKVNTTGITIGADKKVSEKKLYGVALRLGNDDVDIGKLGNILDMNAYSLTFYGTLPQGESNFIDSLIGVSAFKTDIVNVNGDNKSNTDRDGDQIFGSLKIRKTIKKNQMNFTPTAKIDLGYTLLSEYTEVGSDALKLKFDEQEIKTAISSIGIIFDNSIFFESGVLKPNAHLEYNVDISSSSESKFSYVSDTNESYTLSNVNDKNNNLRTNLGLDFKKNNGWSFKSNYERNQSENGYSDLLYIGATYIPNNDGEYGSVSLEGEKTFIKYNKNINGLDLKFISHYNLFGEPSDEYGVNLLIYKNFGAVQ